MSDEEKKKLVKTTSAAKNRLMTRYDSIHGPGAAAALQQKTRDKNTDCCSCNIPKMLTDFFVCIHDRVEWCFNFCEEDENEKLSPSPIN